MRRQSRVRLVALAIGLAAILTPIIVSPAPALGDESGDLYLSPNNASDPDMEQCVYNGVNGFCMYTSQDLGTSGLYPMTNTLGFFSTDGYHWTAEGSIFSESTYVNAGWVQSGAKHLWAPAVTLGEDNNYYLYDPDVSITSQPDSSSFIGVSESTTGPFGPFNPVSTITDTMPDPSHGNQPWNGGYASDPDVVYQSIRGGSHFMVFANGDGSSTHCGDLSVATMSDSMTAISNPQTIAINGASVLGNCGSTGQPYEEGPSLYWTQDWGLGVPGPFLLVFAAKPTSTPSACATNLGEPNTANEVIAYATASSAYGPYTYKGILMCGSSTEWTNQATLMPVPVTDIYGNQHTAIAMYYHDGPSGSTHNRKVHAQCLAFGGGNFAGTMRPVNLPNWGWSPDFGVCMTGEFADLWGLQQSNGQMVTTQINASGYANGELTAGFGRVAMGRYEQFAVMGSDGNLIEPSSFQPWTTTAVTGADVLALATGEYVADWSDYLIGNISGPSHTSTINVAFNGDTNAFTVTLNMNQEGPARVAPPGFLYQDGQGTTTFNLVHYYS